MKILANFNNYNYQPQTNRPAFKADPHINELLKAMETIELVQEEKIIPKVKNTTSKFVKVLRGILLAATLSLGAITGYFAINNETDKDKALPFAVATATTGLGTFGLSKRKKDTDTEKNRTFIVKDKKYGQLKLTEKGMQQYQDLMAFFLDRKRKSEYDERPYRTALTYYFKGRMAILKSEGEIDINNASNNHTFKIKFRKWNLTNEGLKQYLALTSHLETESQYYFNARHNDIQVFLDLLLQTGELPESNALEKYV